MKVLKGPGSGYWMALIECERCTREMLQTIEEDQGAAHKYAGTLV